MPAETELARALTAGLPRDQALGLRLIALARAAAAVHMGAELPSGSGRSRGPSIDEFGMRTQASGLAGKTSEGAA